MRRIFISGAAGFIASHLVDAFMANGDFVIGVDDLSGGEMANLDFAIRRPHQFKFYQSDLTDYAETEEIFRAHRPGIIYHCAAQAHEGASFYDPYFIVRSNSYMSSIIFELAVKYGAEKIVYTSSTSRYGAQKVPFIENMKPKPADIYASQKVASEEMLKMLCDLHGIKYSIAVPRNVFGPRQSMRDLYRNFITLSMNKILRGEPISIYGKNHVRSFSYIEDCLPSFVKLANADVCNGEVVNIGGMQEVCIIDAAKEIIGHFPDKEIKIEELPPRYGEVEICYASSAKSIELLGYEEKVGWREGIAITAEWCKKKGPQEWRPYFLPLLNESAPKPWREFAQGTHSKN